MEVRNCKSCGKLFNVLSNERKCPECLKKLEEKFQDVKAYIEENKGASVEQVAREMDVTPKQIRQWIKEERLVLADGTLGGIVCEKCGKSITTGRFCTDCKKNMSDALQGAVAKPKAVVVQEKKSSGNKMRFL